MPKRRYFLKQLSAATGGIVATGLTSQILSSCTSPAVHGQKAFRPAIPFGVSSGDVLSESAIIWSKTDRPARMLLEWATNPEFKGVTKIKGLVGLEENDFIVKQVLEGLPAGEQIYYRVAFEAMQGKGATSNIAQGQFRTAPRSKKDISFCWSGDTAGQGYGINPDWGGMRIYETMRKLQPDFFLHSGDTIYADGPISSEQKTPHGEIWKNITTEAKSKVAETLEEFRGNYTYNLLDENIRRFHAEVPIIYQWDDHETVNNWYPGEILDDDRYKVKDVNLLAERARKAFLEYSPIRSNGEDPGRIFRHIPYGPSLDVFVIDMRTYRGPNTPNRQTVASQETDLLGRPQIEWLKQHLLQSKATWKVIASDMPIGLLVPDYDGKFENMANGDGAALGREQEMVDLLRFIKQQNIQNNVWLTADVHYTAAHHYSPDRAVFQDFLPFYEFVSGPLNSGAFGPGALDNTFGPKVLYHKFPDKPNAAPSSGYQFFGRVQIDGESEEMKVSLIDVAGEELYQINLAPEKNG